jgi:hypothetical protein
MWTSDVPRFIFKTPPATNRFISKLIAHSWTSEVPQMATGSSTPPTTTVVCHSFVHNVRCMSATMAFSIVLFSLGLHESLPSFIPVKMAHGQKEGKLL